MTVNERNGRRPLAVRMAGYTLVELMAAMLITLFVMSGIYGLMLQNQRTYKQQSELADVQQAARVALDLMTREIRMAGSDPTERAFAPATACVTGTYKVPTSEAVPAAADIAPLTVATATALRIKMDRVFYFLGSNPTVTPTPTPLPTPLLDCSSPADFDYEEDDESLLGDGFIDDEGEDVRYEWIAAEQVLYRTEYRDNVPASVCRPCPLARSPAAISPPVKLPIADNVVSLRFKYYSTLPPTVPCPTGAFLTSTQAAENTYTSDEYEAERDKVGCDPPLAAVPPDLSVVARVRILLTIETDTADPFSPQREGLNLIGNRVTLTGEATMRNRLSF